MNEICGRYQCTNPTARAIGKDSRRINGIELCRACYQSFWELSKKTGRSMEDLLKDNIPPQHLLIRVATVCARQGCGIKLPANASRRTIGSSHVCRACYQAVWEKAKAKGISTEEAFKQIGPRRRIKRLK